MTLVCLGSHETTSIAQVQLTRTSCGDYVALHAERIGVQVGTGAFRDVVCWCLN
jgi:hypothetical protein